MKNQRVKRLIEEFPFRKNEQGQRLCRKCGVVVPKGRSSWCSDKCAREAMAYCYPNWASDLVWRRDKGVCAICGRDMGCLRKLYRKWKCRIDRKWGWAKVREWENRFLAKGLDGSRQWWEVHHIVPVILGGSNELDNLQTVCIPCHKKETKELAARRAKARRKKKPEQLTLFEGGKYEKS